jgi:hypothetical protein
MCSIGCRVGGLGRWGISIDNHVKFLQLIRFLFDSFMLVFSRVFHLFLKRGGLQGFGYLEFICDYFLV